MKKLFRGMILLSFCAALSAEASPLKIFDFQLGAIGVYPTGGGSSWFGQAAWTPTIDLGVIGLRGEAGFTAPKNAIGDRFVATNLEVLGQLMILPMISVEAGGGWHNWMGGNGGSAGALSGGVSIALTAGLDHLYVTYTRLFLGSGVNEFKAGLGFNL